MIPLKREPASEFFSYPHVIRMRFSAQNFFKVPLAQRKQGRFDFGELVKALEFSLKDTLVKLSFGKCAYCESPLSQETTSINAYRPFTGVEESSKDYLGDHYWAEAFEWNNYFATCARCARYKGQRFPVLGYRAAANAVDIAVLRWEQPLLLDPCVDAPDVHLAFLPDGRVVGRTDRGRQSIEVFGLARTDLVGYRREHSVRVHSLIASGNVADLDRLLEDAAPYAAMARQLVAEARGRAQLSTMPSGASGTGLGTAPPSGAAPISPTSGAPGPARPSSTSLPNAPLKEAIAAQAAFDAVRSNISTEGKSGIEHYRARARFIERVTIRNFLSIEELTLDLSQSESQRAPCYAVLGENAVGKSSVLKAIGLVLGGPSYAKRLRLKAVDLLRYGAANGSVSVWISGFREPSVMKFVRRTGKLTFAQPASRALLVGYGSSRLLPNRRHRPRPGMSHAKIDNLFDPFLPLADAEAWLAKAPEAQFNEAALRIRDLLMMPADARLVRRRSRDNPVMVTFDGKSGKTKSSAAVPPQPFEHLSEGYQSMMGFASDLMQIMFGQGYQSMESAQGVVLIDELGNHLHPRWRMHIVGRLRAAFPNVQFIFSTHDPLCLRGLVGGEIVVLRLCELRKVYALTDLPSVSGLRVDQLLRSEHFGLGSTVDPEMQRDYERYLALKREMRVAGTQTEFEHLERRLFAPNVVATSPAERVALQYMEDAQAKGPETPTRNLSVAKLEQDAIAKLRSLFDKVGA